MTSILKLVFLLAICMLSFVASGNANQNPTQSREMRSLNATAQDTRPRSNLNGTSSNSNQTRSNSTRSTRRSVSSATSAQPTKKGLWQRFVDWVTSPFKGKNSSSEPLSGKYYRTHSRRRGYKKRNSTTTTTTTTKSDAVAANKPTTTTTTVQQTSTSSSTSPSTASSTTTTTTTTTTKQPTVNNP